MNKRYRKLLSSASKSEKSIFFPKAKFLTLGDEAGSKPSESGKLRRFAKLPLQEIKQTKEEDKLENVFECSESWPVNSEPRSPSKNNESKASEINDIAGDPKRSPSKKLSEIFIKSAPEADSESRPPVGEFCYTWGPWRCQAAWYEKQPGREEFLESNSRMVYKYALKQCTSKNKEYLECISGLKQQIEELKIEKESDKVCINELKSLVNRLSDGEFDEQLKSVAE